MLNIFKISSFLEGVSYLLLLFGGMPLKYLGNNDVLVKALGMPHGILFMAYIVLALIMSRKLKWSLKTTFISLIVAVIPFGTFYFNKKYL